MYSTSVFALFWEHLTSFLNPKFFPASNMWHKDHKYKNKRCIKNKGFKRISQIQLKDNDHNFKIEENLNQQFLR